MSKFAELSQIYAPDGTVLRHSDRPEPRYSIPRALKNFRLLIEDKENTSYVFKIYESLPSGNYEKRIRDLTMSEHGEFLRCSEPSLAEILDDHAELRKTPKGSLAHVYCDFMESEGLTAAGLVTESDKLGRPKYNDLFQWYHERSRDTHDLFHVLTGYGRDALGEQCVLLFTHGQAPSHGHIFIGYAGALNVKMNTKGSKAPIFGACNQAKRIGKDAKELITQPVRELLKMQYDDVRAMLNIGEPTKYRECHRIWREEGIDPYNLLASENTPESELASA